MSSPRGSVQSITKGNYIFQYYQKKKILFDDHITDIILLNDKKWLYASFDKGYILKINVNDGKIDKKIFVGAGPKGLLVENDGKWLYSINYDSKSISVIDLKTDTNIKTIDMKVRYFFFEEYLLIGGKILTLNYNDKYLIDSKTQEVMKLDGNSRWYEIRTTIAKDFEKNIGYGFARDKIIKIDLLGNMNNVLEVINFKKIEPEYFFNWRNAVFWKDKIYVHYVDRGIFIFDMNKKEFINMEANIFKELVPAIFTGKNFVEDAVIDRREGLGFFSTQKGALVMELNNDIVITIINPLREKTMTNSKIAVDDVKKILYLNSYNCIHIIEYRYKRK